MKDIILASASPRRTDLLKQLGLDFRVIPSDIDETIDKTMSARELVLSLSSQKALEVANKVQPGPLVIGADTVVFKERILGKPENWDEAAEMLNMLQGDWHEVITGVTLIDTLTGKQSSEYEVTRVKMCELNHQMINAYIGTGEPFDKAGAYGIQGMGALLVEGIEGCYFNVVGLPLKRLSSMLETFGFRLL
ncbi:MAG: Maf family protein [Bacillota bacterium]|nr:Maf family protein [Bacillota bacterium]